MKLSSFDAIYNHDRLPAPNYYSDERMHNLAEDMREHALPFQEITSTYVKGGTPSADDVLHEAVLYERWAQQKFPRAFESIIEKLSKPDTLDPTHERELKDLIAETAFVLMNSSMAYNWLALTTTEPQTRDSVRRTQIRLALSNILPTKSRDDMVRNGVFFDKVSRTKSGNLAGRPNILASGMSGTASEIDSALTLQEASIIDPNIVILPASGYFENGIPHRLNADLFAIHTLRRQITPIQVKSVLSHSDVGSYHPTMTFIDASNDLFDTRTVQVPRSSDRISVPWGGLVSVHMIAAEKNLYRIDTPKGKAFHPNERHRMLLQASQVAKQLAKTTKSHNKEAAAIINDRVMQALR